MKRLIDFTPAALLFDMDGTMIESERNLLECWRQAAYELQLMLDDSLWLSMVGLSDKVCRQMLHDRLAADEAEALTTRLGELYDRRVEAGLPLRPGVKRMLDRVAARSLPRAVVTSTHRWRTEQKLDRCGLARYFDTLVTGDEVRESKPAPEIYLLAAERLDVDPARCVVLEDSAAGVCAALAAGMTPIQVPDLVAPDTATRALGHRIVDSLDDAWVLIETALVPTLASRSGPQA
ncbi:HAD family hydrolase [Marilutibacter alkalisoli]|uniref:HAD family phosphatase n=1 Tax=Marilutibacter alkalisoli TaxID=2591633 RepID=A0A514BNM8_9GAMM|nr:HAD family phosphatase [Lysobacter alkalisoli]QDH68998.1 HAD family phosphatase [Lysobacter alkalisoli]